MALTINTNIASINAQRSLYSSQKGFNTALERLSSGLRINSAKDDAAGLSISNRMESQIRGLTQSVRNTNDGISLTKTAEGALNETTKILQKMRELAVQSSSDTNSAEDRTAINAEFAELQEEIDRISSTTEFNNKTLLDGSFSASIQVGAKAGQSITVSISSMSATDLGVDSATIDVSDQTNASSAITALDTAIASVDTQRSSLGATQNRFGHIISNLENIIENTNAAQSRILDADFAQESSNLLKYQILQQSGMSVLSQANFSTQNILSLLG